MTPSLNPIYQRAGVPVATAPSADLVTSVLDETEKTVSRLQRTAGVAIRQLAVVAFAAVIAFGGASTVGTTYGAWSDFDTTGNSAGAGVWTIDVVIDVVNTINPDSGGLTQVKIFGSDTFDPATIDMGTVCFGSATDPAARSCNVVSVNKSGPGALTIMVHFTTNQTGILAGDTHAVLTGKTYDGMNVFGIDEIKTAPAAKSTPTATRSTAPTATLAE
ncbi:MAG TPA: hypothetical protein VM307_06985, partial [Egibacteraceae bacterium]|nr:hypothetical protein [Egibacteraceae bacterium]